VNAARGAVNFHQPTTASRVTNGKMSSDFQPRCFIKAYFRQVGLRSDTTIVCGSRLCNTSTVVGYVGDHVRHPQTGQWSPGLALALRGLARRISVRPLPDNNRGLTHSEIVHSSAFRAPRHALRQTSSKSFTDKVDDRRRRFIEIDFRRRSALSFLKQTSIVNGHRSLVGHSLQCVQVLCAEAFTSLAD